MQAVRHRTWIWLGKALLAGVIAFIALTLFCMVYDNIPVHYATADGATDYHWQPHFLYIHGTEGFSWGKTNNEGYINAIDHTEGTAVDVLVMGSSHMEAMQVPVGMSVAAKLGMLLSDTSVYNIGVSGHALLVCAQNLSAAVQKYAPSKCVVIETMSLQLSDEDLNKVLSGEYPEIPSHTGGIIGLLQKNQFLRHIYHQLKGFMGQADDNDDVAPAVVSAAADTNDPALLSSLLSRMADTAASSGAKLIIAYHPSTTLEKDGSITFSNTEAEEAAFADMCAENGVLFLSMRDRFQREYDENHILPYGFSNTSVSAGHLNRYGHEMMAEELYALMQEVGL